MSDAPAHEGYVSPFVSRFATEEMIRLFSEARKFRTWRRIWVALAEAEKELGLPISDEQIAELRTHQDDLNPRFQASLLY
jgi:adenylosuccinate lyase